LVYLDLKQVLQEKGMTEKDLVAAGMNRITVRMLMTGKNTRIDFSTLDQLCRHLDCKPGDLLVYMPEP